MAAVEAWNAYESPTLGDVDHEVRDALANANPPQPLGEGIAELDKMLRQAARKAI